MAAKVTSLTWEATTAILLEMLDAAREVTGQEIPATIAPRRAGDPSTLIASSEKAKRVLGWQPEVTEVKDIITTAWQWHQAHPHGYQEK